MRPHICFTYSVLIAGIFYCTPSSFAQTSSDARHPEAGLPLFTNFALDDQGITGQNWAVVEDRRGVIYIGNNGGLLEYDGTSWKRVQDYPEMAVLSLDCDDDGRVWIGGLTELGYLEPDSLGRATYVSLIEKIPEENRNFVDVWQTYSTSEGVYFQTWEYIFRWNGLIMDIWPADTRFHIAFVVDDTFYVRQWEKGLMRLEQTTEGDSLHLLPGGERFAQTRIYAMFPYDDDTILIATREEGLFLFDGTRFERFESEVSDLLTSESVYHSTVLKGDRFGFGTLNGGVVIMDREGRLLQQINTQSGLQNDTVYNVYLDASGNLWLALESGVTRIEYGWPLTRHNAETGMPGPARFMVRHENDGRLYIGTRLDGVVVMDPITGRVEEINGTSGYLWNFLSLKDELLIAGDEGVYRIEGNQATLVRPSVNQDYRARSLSMWRKDSSHVFAALHDGVGVLRLSPNGWVDEGRIPGVETDAGTQLQTPEGDLWIGTSIGQVIRVRFPDFEEGQQLDLSASEVTFFGQEQGFTAGSIRPKWWGDNLFAFRSQSDIFRFEPDSDRFVKEDGLEEFKRFSEAGTNQVIEDEEGRFWTASETGRFVEVMPQPGASYDLKPLYMLGDKEILSGTYIGDVMWLMDGKELVRYDNKQNANLSPTFPPLIRQVLFGEDKMYYGGYGKAPVTNIPHSVEAIKFSYAAPGATGTAKFRTYLESFEESWTSWTEESERDFTNVPPGDYRFRVQAAGRGEAVYALTILPPWYRTWWAYGVYAILLGFVGFGVDRVQRKRLLQQERERTALLEAELRAEAAESKAKAAEAEAQALQAENERKQNVEMLSRIGQAITSTLSIDKIIDTVYEHVNTLMDATIFGIGIYNEAELCIDFPATKERGEMLAPYKQYIDDENRLAVCCFNQQREIIIGDLAQEYSNYVDVHVLPVAGEEPLSVLYLPLIHHDHPVGVITTQSFEKNAYTDYYVNILRNLATYVVIALDNAEAYRNLEATVNKLRSTQQLLVQQEKMASLGQLTAGIAHEIKNPLNFINNFAEINAELAGELKENLASHPQVFTQVEEMLSNIKQNALVISQHGWRADTIVKNMMAHARTGSGEHEIINLNSLIGEHLDLAYHGKRAQIPDFLIDIERQFDPAIENVDVMPQEIGRVILNLVGNAFDALIEHGTGDEASTPKVRVSTQKLGNQVLIQVADNGPGMAQEVVEKIFEPFFTTKSASKGTGLGLSLSYDIVTLGHGGTMSVESTVGKGSTFSIRLPLEKKR